MVHSMLLNDKPLSVDGHLIVMFVLPSTAKQIPSSLGTMDIAGSNTDEAACPYDTCIPCEEGV